jgi:hypothetical protein
MDVKWAIEIRLHAFLRRRGKAVGPMLKDFSTTLRNLRSMGEILYRQGKIPDSFTRALWQSYSQRSLLSKQEENGEVNYVFSLRSVFDHTSK